MLGGYGKGRVYGGKKEREIEGQRKRGRRGEQGGGRQRKSSSAGFEGQRYFEDGYREGNMTGMRSGFPGNQEQLDKKQKKWCSLGIGANLCHHRVSFKMKFGPLFSTFTSECHDCENWIQLN